MLKQSTVLMLSLVFVMSATVPAQNPTGGGKPKGDSGSQPKEPPQGKDKVADLAADSLTAKWKDAATLEITGTIKNTTNIAFTGPRQVKIVVTGGDGKPETAKAEAIPMIAANGSHKVTFNTTANKYFDINLKYSLELSAGDATPSNDKKAPMPLGLFLAPGTPTGGTGAPTGYTGRLHIVNTTTTAGVTFYEVQAVPLKDFTSADIMAAKFFKDDAGVQQITASEADTLRSGIKFGTQKNTLIIRKDQFKSRGVVTWTVGGFFGGFAGLPE